MLTTVLQRMDLTARSLIPLVITVLLVTLSVLPLRLTFLDPVAPDWALMSVQYWSVRRPDQFSPVAVFGVGLYADVLSGAPLGTSAFVLLIVYAVVQSQRRYLMDRSFWVAWVVFLLVAALAGLLEWMLVCALANAVLNPIPSLNQYLFTIALYPLLARLLVLAEKAVPDESRA